MREYFYRVVGRLVASVFTFTGIDLTWEEVPSRKARSPSKRGHIVYSCRLLATPGRARRKKGAAGTDQLTEPLLRKSCDFWRLDKGFREIVRLVQAVDSGSSSIYPTAFEVWDYTFVRALGSTFFYHFGKQSKAFPRLDSRD